MGGERNREWCSKEENDFDRISNNRYGICGIINGMQ